MTDERPRRPRPLTISTQGLRTIGARPSLADYSRALWQRRHFIYADARAKLGTKTRHMVLGSSWLVLKPIMDGAVFFLIFGVLLQASRGIENFIGYLLIGVFLFQYTARSLSSGAGSVVGGKNMIRSFTFPRMSLPIATVLRETLNMIPVTATLLVLIVIIPPHAQISWRWVLFPVVLVLQMVFNLGIALIAARCVSHVRDLTNIIAFFTRFWLYGSAVFFSYERFIDHPTILAVMQANPLFVVLDMSRDALLYAETPALSSWILLSCWSVGMLAVGYIFFWRGEENYGKD